MRYRRLGRLGPDVSVLGLGCGDFGGIGSATDLVGKGVPKERAFALMDAALDAGITLFDTANSYGLGESERFIGDWLRLKGPEVRHRLLLSSKVGNQKPPGLSRTTIVRELEGTLARLGVDVVDLYLIHGPDPRTPIAETLLALDDLVGQGKIRHFGAANVSERWMKAALEVSHENGIRRFEWIQNRYSLLFRSDEKKLLPLCVEAELGYTAYSPLAGGWLAGIYRRDEPFPDDSRMALRPELTRGLDLKRTFDALDAFGKFAAVRGRGMPALAVGWLLEQAMVTGAIVGPWTIDHLAQYLDGVENTLSRNDMAELSGLFETE